MRQGKGKIGQRKGRAMVRQRQERKAGQSQGRAKSRKGKSKLGQRQDRVKERHVKCDAR